MQRSQILLFNQQNNGELQHILNKNNKKRLVEAPDEDIKNINNEWLADLLAFSWFFDPTALLILLVAPFPSPTLIPFNIINIGVTNPIPAIAACS